MLNALNEVLRDDYIKDSTAGVGRWNKVIEKHGMAFRLQVPHKAFNRRIGTLAGISVTPDGQRRRRSDVGRRACDSGCPRTRIAPSSRR